MTRQGNSAGSVNRIRQIPPTIRMTSTRVSRRSSLASPARLCTSRVVGDRSLNRRRQLSNAVPATSQNRGPLHLRGSSRVVEAVGRAVRFSLACSGNPITPPSNPAAPLVTRNGANPRRKTTPNSARSYWSTQRPRRDLHGSLRSPPAARPQATPDDKRRDDHAKSDHV